MARRRKNLHIRIPAAFPGSGWGKIGGKNRHDLRAFGGLWARGKSAVFWQTGHHLRVFSTGNERVHFTGFSGSDLNAKRGKGA
jgi:hypothetical protein